MTNPKHHQNIHHLVIIQRHYSPHYLYIPPSEITRQVTSKASLLPALADPRFAVATEFVVRTDGPAPLVALALAFSPRLDSAQPRADRGSCRRVRFRETENSDYRFIVRVLVEVFVTENRLFKVARDSCGVWVFPYTGGLCSDVIHVGEHCL